MRIRHRRLGDDARRRDRLDRQEGRISNEQAEHEPIGARRARRQKSLPPLLPERLTHVLIGRPTSAARTRRDQPDPCQSLRGAEISHVEAGHSVAPEISRELLQRWDAPLGQMAIPLSPQRLLLVTEVESIDDVASLPAVVTWRLRANARVSPVRNLTQPPAGGVNRIDIQCQRARPQTAPGDSSSDTTRATRRALPRAINSSGF